MLINILIIKNYYKHIGTFTFVSPLIKYRGSLKDKGFNINFFHKLSNKVFDCETLFVERRFLNLLSYQEKKFFYKELNKFNDKQKKIFVDTSDSTGQIQKEKLRFFDKYWKGQVLKDLRLYRLAHYGGRYFTNFYKKNFNVKDTNENTSDKITNKNLLKKIQVSWNMGLINFEFYGPIYHKLHSFLNFDFFIKKPFIPRINISKPKDITCRLSFDYHRKTVKFQRTKLKHLLKSVTDINQISRKKYFNELHTSKISVSPFGWGEICVRDFETFICKSCLLKPDMSLIDTWPLWYKKNQSYVSLNWNLKNLHEKIEFLLSNKKLINDISSYGRELYIKYNVRKNSREFFSNRFEKLLKN